METFSNVDHEEIAKFEKLAQEWWNPVGSFKPLHQLNPLRMNYIERKCDGFFEKKILDVGCGGGILSESMAQHGAVVTGIDMGKMPLEIAKQHASTSGVNVSYHQSTAESFSTDHHSYFDVITCMEMLEHVPDPQAVILACADMLKPNGCIFFSTINRNFQSYVKAIIGAEYVLRLLPKGTHQYEKFIKPSELMQYVECAKLHVEDTMGITYNPFIEKFSYTMKLDVNYMVMATKPSASS
jgi:2-polyprenyl-6-hydroxyphenyl methylase/3-demethylubiquinone-9 3-methyltransferase